MSGGTACCGRGAGWAQIPSRGAFRKPPRGLSLGTAAAVDPVEKQTRLAGESGGGHLGMFGLLLHGWPGRLRGDYPARYTGVPLRSFDSTLSAQDSAGVQGPAGFAHRWEREGLFHCAGFLCFDKSARRTASSGRWARTSSPNSAWTPWTPTASTPPREGGPSTLRQMQGPPGLLAARSCNIASAKAGDQSSAAGPRGTDRSTGRFAMAPSLVRRIHLSAFLSIHLAAFYLSI